MSDFNGTWTCFKFLSFGSTSPIKDNTTISVTDNGANPDKFKFTPAGAANETSLAITNSTSDTIRIDRTATQTYRISCKILHAGRLSWMLGLVSDGSAEDGDLGDSNTDSFVAVKTSG